MSAHSWQSSEGLQQSGLEDRSLDRQMIRHLLSRYTPDELSLFIREAQTGSQSDTASIITSTTALSDPGPSLWDTGSIRSFSDTSSITGSIISNVTSKTSRLLKGRSSTSSQAIQTATEQQQLKQEAAWLDDPTTSQAQSDAVSLAGSSKEPKKQGAFMCGFCREEDMVKTCTRKNDLKRHIEDFHNVNAQWHCRQRGCQKIFDWQAAYKQHLKSAHGGSRMSLDEAKVNLCPQVVFACGFENCPQVFEASSDNESPLVFKEYVAHVVKHFDEGSNSGEWTYSARMRNLLRQSTVNNVWTEMVNEATRNQLVWQSQSSGILRKRLECRHIGDTKLLVHYAFMLGSDPGRISKFSPDFVIPVADTCQMNISGHKIRNRGAVPPPPEPDPFQFHISRGNKTALQALLASQRRVYVPPRGSNRPMTAVSRPHQLHSARSTSHLPVAGQHHHHHHMPTAPTSNPMNQAPTPFFTAMPEPQIPPPPPPPPPQAPASPLFDPLTTQPFNPATTMMPQVSLIPDDLHSLRSVGSNTPEPDIEMADTPMMHTDYSSAFPHIGMHTPPADALPSPAMGHHHDFYHHEEPHAF